MIGCIVATKREEVEALRRLDPPERRRPVVPFSCDGPVNIIAELKRRSPSAGFLGEIDEERIGVYSRYAKAISVVTDRTYFGGSLEFLARVAGGTDLPVLCKDFIIDPVQIDHAYGAGADMVLLIVRILGRERLASLMAHAESLGLTCLVELHGHDDLEAAAGLGPTIVGVNARDLDTLRVDLATAAWLLSRLQAPVRVAESGIKSRQDMERLRGANAFLIGETLMRSKDLERTFRGLLYGED